MPRSQKDLFGGAKPAQNMSAMIDLVFLLLIFFMVASKMVTYTKDKNVNIAIASEAKVPKSAEGRIVINVYADGSIHGTGGILTPAQVQTMMADAKVANPKASLLIRGDQDASHKSVREVMAASARGGVVDIIFATFTQAAPK